MLYKVSLYSVFLPLCIGILRFRKLQISARVIVFILALASIPHVATIFGKQNQLPVLSYNYYIIIEAVLWPLFFYFSVKTKKVKIIFTLIGALNVIGTTIYILSNGMNRRFYYELVCLNSFIQVILIAFFFYELNIRNNYFNLKKMPSFWFSAGLLIYAPCTFFVFLFFDKINRHSNSGLEFLWDIHNFFNSLMYILFAIGLSIKPTGENVR